MFSVQNLSQYHEGNRLEAKRAEKGLPNSLWSTYSSFANTNGGYILLGVEEMPDKSLQVVGCPQPQKRIVEFWDTINNPKKVNINYLLDNHVRIEKVENKEIIVIEIPRADRGLKPIYIDGNPYTGTYRRNGEGDYRCSVAMVDAMIRDKGEKSPDSLIIENMTPDVFDIETVRGYRNRMRSARPGHVWERLEDVEFLQKIGALVVEEGDRRRPTSAGLLMFGYENEIVREYPNYFLEYQESYDADTRFTDRVLSSSGEWSGNVCDFFFKIYNKLIQHPNIKIPFRMLDGLTRIDDTPIHQALREALVNCLSNADFYGERGVVVRNSAHTMVFENPGCFRIDIEEALSGGISSPRNAGIMKMFMLLDIGERSGHGIPMIFHSWAEENYYPPTIVESFTANRTILTLSLERASEKNERNTETSEKNERNTETSEKNERNTEKNERNTEKNEQNTETSEKNERNTDASQKETRINTERKSMILAFLKINPSASTNYIADSIGVSRGRVRSYLLEMTRDGIIIAEGNTHTRTYRLRNEP